MVGLPGNKCICPVEYRNGALFKDTTEIFFPPLTLELPLSQYGRIFFWLPSSILNVPFQAAQDAGAAL